MDLKDKTLTRHECGRQDPFTLGDQQFYAQMGFANTSGRCPLCGAARRVSRHGGHRRSERMAEVPTTKPPPRARPQQRSAKLPARTARPNAARIPASLGR